MRGPKFRSDVRYPKHIRGTSSSGAQVPCPSEKPLIQGLIYVLMLVLSNLVIGLLGGRDLCRSRQTQVGTKLCAFAFCVQHPLQHPRRENVESCDLHVLRQNLCCYKAGVKSDFQTKCRGTAEV